MSHGTGSIFTGAAIPPRNAGGAAPDVITEEETKTGEATDAPWNVIVHNDPINLMDYVTRVFMKVFSFPQQKAEIHMMEVHKKGRSLVWSGARERAEFFVQQLHSHLLLATIERAR